MRKQEAKSRAVVLEMIGDLPEADVAPPENVLFVCKLNPATTDEDLEIIFSRFGKVSGGEHPRSHLPSPGGICLRCCRRSTRRGEARRPHHTSLAAARKTLRWRKGGTSPG